MFLAYASMLLFQIYFLILINLLSLPKLHICLLEEGEFLDTALNLTQPVRNDECDLCVATFTEFLLHQFHPELQHSLLIPSSEAESQVSRDTDAQKSFMDLVLYTAML